jgi:transcriptional regulator with XRE-family HTH domain
MQARTRLHKRFCERLRALREDAELTQREMAAKLEISQPAYAAIENGHHAPTLNTIESVAKIFKVEPAELISQREPAAA